jgi:hypothetical protein
MIFSWLFGRDKPTAHKEPPTLAECFNILIEDERKATYGWNAEDIEKLNALWASDRFPKPSVTFNEKGEVFVCPELAKELDKPGNEGLTELLLSVGRHGSAVERRKARQC